MGKQWKWRETLFFGGFKITADGDYSHEIKRLLLLKRKAMTNLYSILKSRDITLPTKICIIKVAVFLVVIYECERWTIKKTEHWRTDAFELWFWSRLFLESPLDSKEIQPVYPRGNQSWIFTGVLMLKLKLQYFGHLMQRLIKKDPDAGKDWRQKGKRMTEDEMVGWHHWLDGYEFEQAPGVGDGQGSLACCSPWGPRVLHNWGTELNWVVFW